MKNILLLSAVAASLLLSGCNKPTPEVNSSNATSPNTTSQAPMTTPSGSPASPNMSGYTGGTKQGDAMQGGSMQGGASPSETAPKSK